MNKSYIPKHAARAFIHGLTLVEERVDSRNKISGLSDSFAQVLITAGAGSAIFAHGQVDFSFGQIDDLILQVMASIHQEHGVYSAVYDVMSAFIQNCNLEDPLDSSSPPFWHDGAGTLTISLEGKAAHRCITCSKSESSLSVLIRRVIFGPEIMEYMRGRSCLHVKNCGFDIAPLMRS